VCHPLEFGHEATFQPHSYICINFLPLKFNFVTEALNCYIYCISLFSCHGIFRNKNIDVIVLLMFINYFEIWIKKRFISYIKTLLDIVHGIRYL
jgi:hypothetical protein